MQSNTWGRMDFWGEHVKGIRCLILFSNDIGTSLAANPNFMHLLRIDIPPRARTDSFLAGIRVVGIGVCQGAVQDEMCGFAAVLVRRVVGIAMRRSNRRNICREMVVQTYGPSVQVKTWPKPHDRTSLSASFRDFAIVDVLCRVCVEWDE